MPRHQNANIDQQPHDSRADMIVSACCRLTAATKTLRMNASHRAMLLLARSRKSAVGASGQAEVV